MIIHPTQPQARSVAVALVPSCIYFSHHCVLPFSAVPGHTGKLAVPVPEVYAEMSQRQ